MARRINADSIKYEKSIECAGHGEFYEVHTVCKEDIDRMPTVDAEEVVHGRWLKLSPWNNHTQSCLCLNCDSISYQKKSGVYIGKIPNYCPNCGAKMDGDGNG